MSDEVIDLTKNKPSEAFSTFYPGDIVLIVATGSVGYLAKEAYKHFFPGQPSVIEQWQVLTGLVEACGKAGATSLKVRVATNAQWSWKMPETVADTKILAENGGTIDLEVIFRSHRRRRAKARSA
jgi:hypothetical protein